MPKGHISPKLAAILRDKEASSKLRSSLAKGETVTVRVENKTYSVSSKSSKSSDERRRNSDE